MDVFASYVFVVPNPQNASLIQEQGWGDIVVPRNAPVLGEADVNAVRGYIESVLANSHNTPGAQVTVRYFCNLGPAQSPGKVGYAIRYTWIDANGARRFGDCSLDSPQPIQVPADIENARAFVRNAISAPPTTNVTIESIERLPADDQPAPAPAAS